MLTRVRGKIPTLIRVNDIHRVRFFRVGQNPGIASVVVLARLLYIIMMTYNEAKHE